MKKVSAEESVQRWNFLMKRRRLATPCASDKEDPFDCSELAVPPTRVLVDDVLEEFVQEWKELDQRKVPQEQVVSRQKRSRQEEATNNDDSGEGQENSSTQQEGEPTTTHRLPNWGWHANRLRLPDKFDYATRNSSPPSSNSNGDRVISLANPLLQVSYEHELWNLFQSVPTANELEQEAMESAACHNTKKLHQEMTQALQENTRLDGHALSRLRHHDRHGLPFKKGEPLISTIRIECWRRRLRRGSSPDCNRMELEFRANQTLLDVHKAIVDLSQDDLWKNESNSDEIDSGLFFIEDTFYTAGSVDYAGPITEWLNGSLATKDGVSTEKLSRRYYLGISPQDPLYTKPMAEAHLDKLHMRLGVRYHHVHHGDVEFSVFFTDVRLAPQQQQSYPVVHDVWTPSYPMAECEACQRLAAAVVTAGGDKLTHGNPTALCHSCVRLLYPASQQAESATQPYNVYREQADLSMGHETTKALF